MDGQLREQESIIGMLQREIKKAIAEGNLKGMSELMAAVEQATRTQKAMLETKQLETSAPPSAANHVDPTMSALVGAIGKVRNCKNLEVPLIFVAGKRSTGKRITICTGSPSHFLSLTCSAQVGRQPKTDKMPKKEELVKVRNRRGLVNLNFFQAQQSAHSSAEQKSVLPEQEQKENDLAAMAAVEKEAKLNRRFVSPQLCF